MPGARVEIEHLAQFRRDLKKMDAEVRKEFDRSLRELAKTVGLRAREIASQKTTRRSGDLGRGIKWRVRRGEASVVSTAEHGGFPYPLVLEYGGRKGGAYGPRAHINPAVDEAEPKIGEELERLIARAARKANL